ncbi:MAG: TetR/AcrR family transcriptional regulator [Aeromicrobium sp.]
MKQAETSGADVEAIRDALDDWRTYPELRLPPILAVALEQIGEHGYDATSVRTIAKELGVTVPALYYHFENKQAMLVALLDYAMATVHAHAQAALDEAGTDCVRRLSAVVESIVLYMAHHSDLAFLDSERRSLTEENRARYFASRDELEGYLRDAVQSGAQQGVFTTPHPEECSRAILSMCQGIATWYRLGGPVPPQAMAERYVEIALAAVGYRP